MKCKLFNIHLYRILPVLICGLFSSCEDFLDVEVPDNKIVSKTIFNDGNTANNAVVGIYNELFRSYFSGGGRNSIHVLAGLSADNLQPTMLDNDLIEYGQNEVSTQNPSNLNLWSSTYNIVYMANAVIDGLETSQGVSNSIKARLLGEAKFIRAFVYFYLVNLYGEVPVVLTPDYRTNAVEGRNSVEEVYSQIIEDLEGAIEVLDPSYEDGGRLRANQFTAKALLARVHLHKGNWERAEILSNQVIAESQTYNLLDDMDQVFLADSKEAIWQISPIGSGSALAHTKEGNLFIIEETPNYLTPVSLSDNLIASFGREDLRLTNWINTFSEENKTFYYPFKYKVKYAPSNEITEYSMVLRLAEQYLIRCEAHTRQGKLSQAIADLDKIRNRANLSLISIAAPEIDQKALLDSIDIERRRELFTEWGHRWLDLKRTGKVSNVLSPIKTSWQETDALYPIPEDEINKNPNLRQNEGY